MLFACIISSYSDAMTSIKICVLPTHCKCSVCQCNTMFSAHFLSTHSQCDWFTGFKISAFFNVFNSQWSLHQRFLSIAVSGLEVTVL